MVAPVAAAAAPAAASGGLSLAGAGSLMTGFAGLAGALMGGGSSGNNIDLRPLKRGVEWRVRDANRAGIHPLAAMGMPTAGGFASPVGPSTGARVADAVAAGGDILARYGQQRDQQREQAQLSNELLRLQQAESAARARESASNVNLNNARALATLQNMGQASSLSRSVVANTNARQDAPEVVEFFGNKWTPDPNTSPAQVFSDHYGDVIGEAAGIARAVGDLGTYIGRVLPPGTSTTNDDFNWQ